MDCLVYHDSVFLLDSPTFLQSLALEERPLYDQQDSTANEMCQDAFGNIQEEGTWQDDDWDLWALDNYLYWEYTGRAPAFLSERLYKSGDFLYSHLF